MGKKVLVTGGTGMIGIKLINLLVEKEWLGSEWLFKLAFEDNPIQNQRSV